MNFSTLALLTSRASNATSWWMGRPERFSGSCASVLMALDGFLQPGIAQRQERPVFQLLRKPEQPNAADAERRGNVQPAQVKRLRREVRSRQPKEIHGAHQNDECGEPGQEFRAALQIARKKQEERQREVKDQQNNRNGTPASIQPRAIKRDLLREVAGPDDQELREREISPQHHEREEQLAQIVQVPRLEHMGHRLRLRQKNDNDNHQRHCRNHLAGNEQEAINRGGPMRRERHHPVDGGKSHGEDIQRSEEHTSELQSLAYLVCRLLLEKKKKNPYAPTGRRSAHAPELSFEPVLL